jgi:hypothetical protein
MSVFKDSRWQEILDAKKEWSVKEHSPDEPDLFEVEVVVPLRELRDEGRITIQEVESPSVAGGYRVGHIFLREILDNSTRNV